MRIGNSSIQIQIESYASWQKILKSKGDVQP